MSELNLYYLENCPFCIKVLDYLENKNFDIELTEINEVDMAREFLKKNGGKIQVPCLFIDGDPLYESDDIIEWFKDNLENK
ncbi:glutaredoxin [Halanaerobiaceae bacterium Z-7014]|uniref:Glutaredoxin n=1 Tax=Halonatronomonas betaini TaxID=2778430 RepID=A0A931AR84_9FIRM|nr:glutaredoxin [Halonatronomonas betaini]